MSDGCDLMPKPWSLAGMVWAACYGVARRRSRAAVPALLLCVLACIAGRPALADDSVAQASMFTFNGFGTAGAVHSSQDQADFTSSVFKPNGAGYSHNWSVDVDSRIGAQLSAAFTPQLSAVVQIISEQNYDNSYSPAVEWANVRYALTPDFSIRLGRIELPTYLVSEVRKVGYANPWVRPPGEVYSVAPVTSNDGVDFSYRLSLGEVTNTLRAAYGISNKLRFPRNVEIDIRNLWGIFESAEYAGVLLHASYLETKATVNPSLPLFDAFRQFGPAGVSIATAFELSHRSVSIVNLGASYDPGAWFLMSEWSRISSQSFLSVNEAWYVSSGYRIRNFTPYATFSQIRAPRASAQGLDATQFPPQIAATIAALNGGLAATLATTHHVQRTISVGMRWDVMKNTDFKVQYDHVRIGAGSTGTLINAQPGFNSEDAVNIFSATVDFVF